MFCASEAATAICRSAEQQVISSSTTTIHLGSGRAIDRHNPIIHGSRRSVSSSTSPSPSPSSGTTTKKPAASASTVSSHHPKPHQNLKKSTSDHAAAERKSSGSLVDAVRNSSYVRPSAYFAPTDSRRHLLSNNLYMDKQQPHSERVLALNSKKFTGPKDGGEKPVRCSSLKNDDVPSSDKYCSPFRISSHQVVVVRVSLHCKGCAGKVKKYISRMQGVTSFNIDLDAKKVIVVGDVTRSEVLASISKVRTAQLLPPERPNDAKQVIII